MNLRTEISHRRSRRSRCSHHIQYFHGLPPRKSIAHLHPNLAKAQHSIDQALEIALLRSKIQ